VRKPSPVELSGPLSIGNTPSPFAVLNGGEPDNIKALKLQRSPALPVALLTLPSLI
jgi:hypothetical protein